MKKIYIYVNGIMNVPGSSKNWTGRAVTSTHLQTQHYAEKVEYLTFATFTRLFGQRGRVKKLARTLSFYDGWEITLVGHSNGCAVILDALKYLEWPPIKRVVFFSPACITDCKKNGVRAAQEFGRLDQFEVFVGGRDRPLRYAATWVGRMWGYGTMGIKGPTNHVPAKTRIVVMSQWGHSDWWSDFNFPWTMRQVLGNNPSAAESEKQINETKETLV